MSFLALASQKSLMTLQMSFLQLQYNSISNQIQAANSHMTEIKKRGKEANSDYDESNDNEYLYYEQLDEELQTEKDSIDTQLEALKNEVSSLKTMVNNNIKSSCTLNLASGG